MLIGVAEGVATADGQVVGSGVFDDPSAPPPLSADAPKGWTWNRKEGAWQPKVRGPVLWRPDVQAAPSPLHAVADPERGPEGGPGDQAQHRDPDPSWWQGEAAATTTPIQTFQLDAKARADIKALIALAYTVPGEVLPLADPYCFGPLGEAETATNVIDAVSDIVCGSPRVAKWAASAAGLMPWIKLGIALKPVAVGAFHHHVLKDVEVTIDREAREVTVTKRDWSAYTAA